MIWMSHRRHADLRLRGPVPRCPHRTRTQPDRGVALTAAYATLARRNDRQELPRTATALFAFVFVSYRVWLPIFAVYRYLLPIEMLSGVVGMAAASYLARASAVPPLMVAVAVCCWVTTKPLEWGHTFSRDRYVEVQAPALAANTIVLIVGDDPVSERAMAQPRQ